MNSIISDQPYGSGQCFDFSKNKWIREIKLYVNSKNTKFKLPEEIEPKENDFNNIPSTPHPMRKLEINIAAINEFNLEQLNTYHFSNLTELCLRMKSVVGELQGRFFMSLRSLIFSYLNREVIVNFTDVDSPLEKLVLSDCEGTFLMRSCPSLLSIFGKFDVQDRGTFLSRVKNLDILFLKISHIDQWPYILGAGDKGPAITKDEYLGKRVQQLTLLSMYLLDKEIYIYHHANLTKLRIDNLCTVINATLLPLLQLLEITRGRTTLKSTFSNLEFLALETQLVDSDWTILSQTLRMIQWNITGEFQAVVYDNAIRGFLSEIDYHLFLTAEDYRLRKERVLFPKLLKFVYCSTSYEDRFINNIDLSKVKELRLELPYNCWGLLQNLTLYCKEARLIICEKSNAADDGKDSVKLPYIPIVEILQLSNQNGNCSILLDGKLNNLVELSIAGMVSFGENLSCLRLMFMEVLGINSDDQTEYIKGIEARPIGNRNTWLRFVSSGQSFKLSSNFVHLANSPKSTTALPSPKIGNDSQGVTPSLPNSNASIAKLKSDIAGDHELDPNSTISVKGSSLYKPAVSSYSPPLSNWCFCCFTAR